MGEEEKKNKGKDGYIKKKKKKKKKAKTKQKRKTNNSRHHNYPSHGYSFVYQAQQSPGKRKKKKGRRGGRSGMLETPPQPPTKELFLFMKNLRIAPLLCVLCSRKKFGSFLALPFCVDTLRSSPLITSLWIEWKNAVKTTNHNKTKQNQKE